MATITTPRITNVLAEIRDLKQEKDTASEIYTGNIQIIEALKNKHLPEQSPNKPMLKVQTETLALAKKHVIDLTNKLNTKISNYLSYEAADLNALRSALSTDHKDEQSNSWDLRTRTSLLSWNATGHLNAKL